MNYALMTKIASSKTTKGSSALGFAGGVAISSLKPMIHHLSSKIAKDSKNPPDDDTLGERASAAYKKKRNRSLAGSVIGAAIGSAAHNRIAKKHTTGADSYAASAVGALIGGRLGEKTLSKKDRDDIAKYKFHEDIRNQFMVDDGWMDYKSRDHDPKDSNVLDVVHTNKKKGREFMASMVKGKNFDRINDQYKKTGTYQ